MSNLVPALASELPAKIKLHASRVDEAEALTLAELDAIYHAIPARRRYSFIISLDDALCSALMEYQYQQKQQREKEQALEAAQQALNQKP